MSIHQQLLIKWREAKKNGEIDQGIQCQKQMMDTPLFKNDLASSMQAVWEFYTAVEDDEERKLFIDCFQYQLAKQPELQIDYLWLLMQKEDEAGTAQNKGLLQELISITDASLTIAKKLIVEAFIDRAKFMRMVAGFQDMFSEQAREHLFWQGPKENPEFRKLLDTNVKTKNTFTAIEEAGLGTLTIEKWHQYLQSGMDANYVIDHLIKHSLGEDPRPTQFANYDFMAMGTAIYVDLLVELIIRKGFGIKGQKGTYLAALELILKNWGTLATNESLLLKAIEIGHAPLVDIILQSGTPNLDIPLARACSVGRFEIAKTLHAHGAQLKTEEIPEEVTAKIEKIIQTGPLDMAGQFIQFGFKVAPHLLVDIQDKPRLSALREAGVDQAIFNQAYLSVGQDLPYLASFVSNEITNKKKKRLDRTREAVIDALDKGYLTEVDLTQYHNVYMDLLLLNLAVDDPQKTMSLILTQHPELPIQAILDRATKDNNYALINAIILHRLDFKTALPLCLKFNLYDTLTTLLEHSGHSNKEVVTDLFFEVLFSDFQSQQSFLYKTPLIEYIDMNQVATRLIDKRSFFNYEEALKRLNAAGNTMTEKQAIWKTSRKLMQRMAAHLYGRNMDTISHLIFSHPGYKKSDQPAAISYAQPSQIIANNEGYIAGSTISNGQRLFADDEQTLPIGYNIHVPPTPNIKDIFIHVYGGNDSRDRAFKPGSLADIERQLLSQGTMTITLNLMDLLALKKYQLEMPEELHTLIQSSIHQFFLTLKNHPEQLHPDLAKMQLDKKPIFLYGASFGGVVSVRHAQLFPGTFTGYISHDGAISSAMFQSSDLLLRTILATCLDAAEPSEIDKLKDPLLLLQNSDDSNVNAKVLFAFYEALCSRNKADLARICITQTSNPIPKIGDETNRGHYTPASQEDFTRYAKVVSKFMSKGVSAVPEITVWQAYSQGLLANKHYRSATAQQRFVAHVMEQARFDIDLRQDLRSVDTIWSEKLKPLFYTFEHVHQLCTQPASLKNELHRLEKLNLPTDEMIIFALENQSDRICQFLREEYHLNFSKSSLISDEMVAQFRSKLKTTSDPLTQHFLLSALYMANPMLMEPLLPQFEKDLDLQNEVQAAKEALQAAATQHRKLMAKVWQGSARESLKTKSFLEYRQKGFQVWKNGPYEFKQADYQSLFTLAKKALQYKNTEKEIIAEIDHLLQRFSHSTTESVMNNRIWSVLVKASLTSHPGTANALKKKAVTLILETQFSKNEAERPKATSQMESYLSILSRPAPKQRLI